MSTANTVDDTNSRTAQLVDLICEIGPDIPEISRRLGQFKESVRYRYKEKVLGKGFSIQASPSHEKLGLKRVLMLLDFAPSYKGYANSILSAMNELSYVVFFEKRMFTGDYIVEASVPVEFVQSFTQAMFELEARGMFTSLQVIPFDWFRTVPMHTNYYNFDNGRWEFDWSNPVKPAEEAAYQPASRAKFDMEDLLIIKELQMDATRSFVEISEKLKQNYKRLAWHQNSHVLKRELISGYHLRWMGTTYSTLLERALHRQHRYHKLGVLARNLSENEKLTLIGKLHTIPFIWNEMVAERDYFAQFFFPTEFVTEAYQFLTSVFAGVKDKITTIPLDQTEALSFTFSYQLFDEQAEAWTFDGRKLVERFDTLIAKIKEIGEPA